MNKPPDLRSLMAACLGLATLSLAGAQTAHAIRVITTPLAELLPEGKYGLQVFALKEEKTEGDLRMLYRFDARISPRIEVGAFVIDPKNAPRMTQLNVQGLLLKEEGNRPTVSVGLWDAANIGQFSGRKTGGSFFIAASKTLKPIHAPEAGERPTPPVKVNLGVGTNRLNGVFGGAIVPFSPKTGLHIEYSPTNLRLPKAEGWNAGVYYWVQPKVRARASWMGGNLMLDVFYLGNLG